MLSIPGHWVWDFWHVQDGAQHHLFFLKAKQTPENPDLRHFNQTIGHAVSGDLRQWTVLRDAFAPSTSVGAWDDGTTWTGSIIRHDDLWWMFYTGTTRREHCLVQRVGAAISVDLNTWERVGEAPLVEADPLYYELLDLDRWHDQAWRDPYVVKHDGLFHMYLTARVNYGPNESRGVIGHATSTNLRNWTVLPAVSQPGLFGQLEVPQLVETDGDYLMLFCTAASTTAPTSLTQHGLLPTDGTFQLKSNSFEGPFEFVPSSPIGQETGKSLYAGKVISYEGQNYFLGFINQNSSGEFVGIIDDPIPVTIEARVQVILC